MERKDANDFGIYAVGARHRYPDRKLQRPDLLRLIDDEEVSLARLGVLFAVPEKKFEGAEVDDLDAETEDVVAVFVDGEGVDALSQE